MVTNWLVRILIGITEKYILINVSNILYAYRFRISVANVTGSWSAEISDNSQTTEL